MTDNSIIRKSNILILFNITVLLFVFFIVFNYQHYIFLYKHDSTLYYIDKIPPVTQRIPATLIYYFMNIFIPDKMNLHFQDYQSSYGAFIISCIYVVICYLFTNLFYITKNDKIPAIIQKDFSILFLLSFLLLTVPVFYLLTSFEITYYFLWIDEVLHFCEYFLGYIFLLPFLIILGKIIINETKIKNNFILFFFCICAFLSSFWNELFSLTVFFTSIILMICLFIANKQLLLKNKELTLIILCAILGTLCFFLPGDHFSHKYSIINMLYENLSRFPIFIEKYFKFIFFKKYIFWSLIILISLFIIRKKSTLNNQKINKKINNTFMLCFSLLSGYLTTCLFEIFGYGIIFNLDYSFMREFDNIFYNHLLIITIYILSSALYYQLSGKIEKNIIRSGIFIVFTIFSYILIQEYPKLTELKCRIKILLYKIEKTNLIYSSFGETSLLKKDNKEYNILKRRAGIFAFGNIRFNDLNYVNSLYTNGYQYYFIYTYKNNFIGFSFVDNNLAEKELSRRMKLLDERMETDKELKENGIKFNKLKKKYEYKILTLNNIDEMENKYGKSDILEKAKAYINFKNKNYNAALSLYNEYLQTHPNDFDSLFNTAKIYSVYKNYKKEKETYLKLISLDPQNLEFNYNYLKILYEQDKDYHTALKICNKLLEKEANINIFIYVKGLIYLALNNEEMSIQYLTKAKNRGYNININDILKERPSKLPLIFECKYLDELERT